MKNEFKPKPVWIWIILGFVTVLIGGMTGIVAFVLPGIILALIGVNNLEKNREEIEERIIQEM